MTATTVGKLSDPQWRQDRARKAAAARTSLDHHIAKLVDAAPRLTKEQRERLSVLLRPVDTRPAGRPGARRR